MCENLTITEIDLSKASNFNDLQKDMALVHSIIYASFSTKEKNNRILFHCLNKKIRILSEDEPNRDHLAYKFNVNKDSVKTKPYEKINNLKCGDSYSFILVGNPVVEQARTRKIIPLKSPADRGKWLVDRSEKLGFYIKSLCIPVGHPVTGKNNIFLNCAVFSGTLTITDLEIFKNTLRFGIGREKAFGFGLLWLDSKVNEN